MLNPDFMLESKTYVRRLFKSRCIS